MTAPGGTPGLPTGVVLTLENMESRLQDMTAGAMKGRAVEWFPSMANNTTGGNPLSILSPFGFLTDIWSRWNSTIARADPSAVNSVDDLGPLFTEFVENLPVIGQFVTLVEAFLGNYTGTDPTLLAIQNIFGAIPKLIGGLLSGSQIPGLDASKIISGQFITDLIPNLSAAIINSGTFLAGLIPGLDASKITSGVFPQAMLSITNIAASIVSGIFGAAQIPALDASKITSGQFATSIVSGLDSTVANLNNGIQGTLNGIVNGIKGLTGQYWTQTDAQAALKQQAAAVAAAAAAVAALQGQETSNNTGGVNVVVDFSQFPDTANLPSVFTEYYVGGSAATPPGSWGVASGAAVCTNSEDYYQRKMALSVYNVINTTSDYQRVGGVWNGAPGVGYQNPTPFFTPVPYYNPFVSEHVLTFRWKDINNHCRVRFTGDAIGLPGTCYLETVVNGTVTVLGQFGHVFQGSTAYFVDAGLGGGVRQFRIYQGSTPIATITDTNNVSQIGAAFRGGGPGAVIQGAQGASLPANPAGMVAFTLQDNNPNVLVFGKVARWYRANTAGAAISTGNTLPVPHGMWDTLDYNVGGIFSMVISNTATSNNCRVTVSEKGLYEIIVRAGWSGGNLIDTHLLKNGVVYKQGMTQSWAAFGTFRANLAANDYFNISMRSNGGSALGEATGTGCYLEVRQLISGA